jgi:acylphosphatase
MAAKKETAARRYIVRGFVQGVGYRAFAVRHGSELGLTGWARNLSDGTVEVHAQGEADALAEYAGRLRQGPRFSEVRGVEEQEAALIQSRGFSIKY